jgi:acyl-CoA synthetase (NDP forming)
MLLSNSELPKGGRIGVITSTGGGAIIITDKIEKSGLLSLPQLSESTIGKISKRAVSFASIGNPIDLTGQLYVDAQMYGDTLNLLAQDDNVDIVLPIVSMVSKERATDRASRIIHARTLTSKPIVTWWAGGSLSESGFGLLDESKVALFKSPDRCIKALSLLTSYSQFRKKFLETKAEENKNAEILMDNEKAKNLLRKERQLTEHEAKVLLSFYGISVAREEIATSEEQGIKIASKLGYPVVLKISSPEISHKSDAGGVKVNLTSESEVRNAYREILKNCREYDPSAHVEGVLVQEMVTGGTEVIIGISRDPAFGLMIVFGLGGIFVEIMRDISVRILPITYTDAHAMVEEIKGYDILKGARGRVAADIDAIVALLLKVSALAINLSQFISEIDLNPVMVFNHGKGVKVVDALFRK